jgi:hypothetical protein
MYVLGACSFKRSFSATWIFDDDLFPSHFTPVKPVIVVPAMPFASIEKPKEIFYHLNLTSRLVTVTACVVFMLGCGADAMTDKATGINQF